VGHPVDTLITYIGTKEMIRRDEEEIEQDFLGSVFLRIFYDAPSRLLSHASLSPFTIARSSV